MMVKCIKLYIVHEKTETLIGLFAEILYAIVKKILHLCQGMSGAPIAQFEERQTLDPKDAGLILTQGTVLCP